MKWFECVRDFGLDTRSIVLSVGALLAAWILWRLQKSSKQIDFMDLLVTGDGKASWSKMTAIFGFLVGTWVVVVKTLAGTLTDEMFLIYYAICIGSPVAFGIISMRAGQGVQQLPSTTTVVTPNTTTVTTSPPPATSPQPMTAPTQ